MFPGTGYTRFFYKIPQNGKETRLCCKCTEKYHSYNQSEDEHIKCGECGAEEDIVYWADGKLYCLDCFDKEFEEVSE